MTQQTVLIGPPGTGKTTYCKRQVTRALETGEYQPADLMLCSLTKTAAAEMAGRISLPKGRIGTLHSFAFRALQEAGETPIIAESKISEWNELVKTDAWMLSGGAADTDESPVEQQAMSKDGDKVMAEMSLLRSRMIPFEHWPKQATKTFAVKWNNWKEENGYTDFTDLLEQSLAIAPFAPRNPRLIFVDEYQDMSTLENALLSKWSIPADQYITVGDHHQALYEWRGADTSIMESIDKKYRRVLAQSYRVPEQVRACAVSWLSGMQGYEAVDYHPRREDPTDQNSPPAQGSVAYSDVNMSPGSIGNLLTMIEKDLAADRSVMVLTSCAYMLNPLLAFLRREGIPFANRFRSKSGAWNPLGKRKGVSMPERLSSLLTGTDCPGAADDMWSATDLKNIFDPVEAKGVLQSGGKAKITGLDKTADLATILTALNEHLIDADELMRLYADDWRPLLAWWATSLLTAKQKTALYPVKVLLKAKSLTALTEPPALTVGTIHSVKGGEADSVYLAPDLSFAGYGEWTRGHAGIHRLFYVGMTRAREKLTLLSSMGRAVEF